MTSAAPATTTVRDSLSYQDALLDIVGRAQRGDVEAMPYVFDNVLFEVFRETFLATHDRREAERATHRALGRLPAMLRSRRFQTLSGLRAALADEAQKPARHLRKAGASAGGMEGLRAGIRHLVLISAASIAAAGALILAL